MEDPISPSKNIYVDAFLVNKPPPLRTRPDCATCAEEFDSVCLTCLNCYDCCIGRDKNKCAFCGGNVPCKDLCDSCGMCCQPCCDCFDDMNYDEDGIPLRRATPVKRHRRHRTGAKKKTTNRRRRGGSDDDDEDYDPRNDPNIKRRIRQVPWTPDPEPPVKKKIPLDEKPIQFITSSWKPDPNPYPEPETVPRTKYGPHAWEVSSQSRFVQTPNPAYEPSLKAAVMPFFSTGADNAHEHLYPGTARDWLRNEGQ